MTSLKEFISHMFHGSIPKKGSTFYVFYNLIAIILCSAVFGLVIGTYSGGMQLLYTSIKVPSLMVLTTFFVFPFLTVFTFIISGQISFDFILRAVIFTLNQTALVMFGLVPVMWLFIQTGEYRLNILAMSGLFMIAGAFGIIRVNKVFHEFYKISKWKVLLITVTCGITYIFVAGQIWWLIRPWIGYTYQEQTLPIIRIEQKDEIKNVYESLQLTGATYYKRNILKNE